MSAALRLLGRGEGLRVDTPEDRPRLRTHLFPDGDVVTLVARDAAQDTALIQLHLQRVREAAAPLRADPLGPWTRVFGALGELVSGAGALAVGVAAYRGVWEGAAVGVILQAMYHMIQRTTLTLVIHLTAWTLRRQLRER